MHIALLALLLAVPAAPAPAVNPVQPKSQFLDSSVVTFPKVAGPYRLSDTTFDDATWQAGIRTKWTLPDVPQGLVFTLFVYPVGEAPEAKVVAAEIADVETAIRRRGQQGDYDTVRVGARQPFQVVARKGTLGDKEDLPFGAAPFDPTPKAEAALAPRKDANPVLALLAANAPPGNSTGLRQTLLFKHDGVETRSLGYAFYRHLFAFKVRVSVPAAEMDTASFEAASDAAVRYIVPQVDVANFGTCGTVFIGPEFKNDEAGMATLVGGAARVHRSNCRNSGTPGPGTPATESERRTIVYPAGAWGSD